LVTRRRISRRKTTPQAKDALVASVTSIKAMALTVMNAASGQMTDPPDRHEER
jgi:hypothetical protein